MQFAMMELDAPPANSDLPAGSRALSTQIITRIPVVAEAALGWGPYRGRGMVALCKMQSAAAHPLFHMKY
jgi:hypothetical protein